MTLYKDTSLKWTLRNGPTILQYFCIILYKADTPLKWTPKVDPWHPFVFLLTPFETDTFFKGTPEFIPTVIQSFSLTVFKADTSIKWTPRVCPCHSSVIFFDSQQGGTSLKCTTRAQPSLTRSRVCLVTQHSVPSVAWRDKNVGEGTKLDLTYFCISLSTCNRKILSRILISSPVKACWYIVVAVTQEDSLKRIQLYFISRNVDKGNKNALQF